MFCGKVRVSNRGFDGSGCALLKITVLLLGLLGVSEVLKGHAVTRIEFQCVALSPQIAFNRLSRPHFQR